MKHLRFVLFAAILLAGTLATVSKPLPAPDAWWTSLEGEERRRFIESYTIVHSYFSDELKLSFERAVARIDELTGIEKKQGIEKLRRIVEWAEAQKRLATYLEINSDSPKVWLRDQPSIEKVLGELNKQEEMFRSQIDSASKAEREAREAILKIEK